MDVTMIGPDTRLSGDVRELEVPRAMSEIDREFENLHDAVETLIARLEQAGILSPETPSDDPAKLTLDTPFASPHGQRLAAIGGRIGGYSTRLIEIRGRLEA